MSYPLGYTHHLRVVSLTLFVLFFTLIISSAVDASVPNQIQRIEIREKPSFTRISFKLSHEPRFKVSKLTNNRLRVSLFDTDSSLFKSLRRYSDSNIGGLLLKRRGDDVLITFATVPGRDAWRAVHVEGLSALSLDVGPLFSSASSRPLLPGRERIRSGAEKLLKNFDPPLKPEIPFIPTDRKALKQLLNDEDQALFMAAEGALYKGKLTAAEDVFAHFSSGTSKIRPLALYRLAETQYRLQKYSQSLATFREAVLQWQEFLEQNPAIMFYYGDSIARNGDLPGGRQLLKKLIVAHADKKFAAVLLVRMADVLSRQGDEDNAKAIYRNVSELFGENKAQQIAQIKLSDQTFLEASPLDYLRLSATYKLISDKTSDFDLREETTFKYALLEAINGPADTALDLIISYQKRYPKGVYSTVIRDIRDDLVVLVYRGKDWSKNPAELIRLVTDNQDYLAATASTPNLFQNVTKAFEKAGRPLDLISLYAGLLERPWIGEANAPYLTLEVADQSELLGDTMMSRKVLQSFILRNPSHPQSRWARERLGAIQYAAKELTGVRVGLVWLLNKNEQAIFPISYYYLGRALWDSKEFQRSGLAMELYIAAVKGLKVQPPLVADAFYVAASSKQALGDRKGAVVMLENGIKVVPKMLTDQFYYKLGELASLDGRTEQAKALFEKVVKEGKDPDWKSLARQSLEDSKFVRPSSPQSP